MSYKFILGHNPQHEPGKRKQYIVCIEPHTAVIEVHEGPLIYMIAGKFIDSHVLKGKVYSMVLISMHAAQLKNGEPNPFIDSYNESMKMLRNAWHWYKSVLDKQ